LSLSAVPVDALVALSGDTSVAVGLSWLLVLVGCSYGGGAEPSPSELLLFDSLFEVSEAPSPPVGVVVSSAADSDGVVEEGTSELVAAVSVGVVLEVSSETALLALALPVGATIELLPVTEAMLVPVEYAVIV
jgi:hypothetical protein